jgi:sugar lactone lactonase YvrE
MKHPFKILALLATLSTALAAPSEINYQGVLTDQQGNPVNGVRALQIKLYDAPTGGNMTYQENIGNVTVADGIYSFKFGASGNGIATALNGNDHLALVVDSVEQPTRTKILAVPYALKASESADAESIEHILVSLNIIPRFEPGAIVSTLAGSGGGAFLDGQGTLASFLVPCGVAVDGSGNVYVADNGNNRIRKISLSGDVTTLAGSGTSGYADGQGTAASFRNPFGVAVDGSGNVYVTDMNNHRIRKITSSGIVTTLAGSGTHGYADGQGTSASFSSPQGVAVDGIGNVYVADHGNNRIRKITSSGNVTTLAGLGDYAPDFGYADGSVTEASFRNPGGLAVDGGGNIYVADTGNGVIRKITPSGNVTTLAGGININMHGERIGGFIDGQGTSAKFNYPNGVAVDGSGNVYVADTGNHRIRKITPSGSVTTLAGLVSGWGDGQGRAATFNSPYGVSVDGSGNVYVADSINHRVRKITIIGN